ncbi:AGAP011335-PA, partial [Anopheles gambiae str. PEST]
LVLYSERERNSSVASAKCDDHQARSVLLPPRLSRTLPVASRALVEAPKPSKHKPLSASKRRWPPKPRTSPSLPAR